jgi:hypothetical protein
MQLDKRKAAEAAEVDMKSTATFNDFTALHMLG